MKKNIMNRANRVEDLMGEQECQFVQAMHQRSDSAERKHHKVVPANYEEAKMMCKARKRKERQESTSSVSQERKAIRSNSEERPVDAKLDMRRVVSHEDFCKEKTNPLQEHNEVNVSVVRSTNVRILNYDDYERQRCHERFAVPLSQRGRRMTKSRRRIRHRAKSKEKSYSDKHNNNNSNMPSIEDWKTKPQTTAEPSTAVIEDKQTPESPVDKSDKEDSPSPVLTPISSALDLTMLHKQIEGNEPIKSSSSQEITDETDTLPTLSVASNRLLSSPRNSIMITHRIYLDPNIPQTKATLELDTKSPIDKKMKHLYKQINSVKRKIRQSEEEFQMLYGHKPSHSDAIGNKSMMALHSDLSKLKREYKQLKDAKGDGTLIYHQGSFEGEKPDLKEIVNDLNKKLQEKRASSNRPQEVEEMTSEQILEEKVAMQKTLLYLESVYGRPSNKEDRDLVRPLYDQYRNLKRILLKVQLLSNTNELATINEYEAMDFKSTPSQSVDNENETEKQNPSSISTDSDTDISLGENLHNLTLDELLSQQRKTTDDKKKMRRALQEFENDFQMKTGKKMQKEDKASMANVYQSYKQTKAKLRLLDALVEKHSPLSLD